MLQTIFLSLSPFLPTVLFTILPLSSYSTGVLGSMTPIEELLWGLLLFALGSLLAVTAIFLIIFLIPRSESRGHADRKGQHYYIRTQVNDVV